MYHVLNSYYIFYSLFLFVFLDSLKKDVFPLIQALTQDTSKEVRAAICMELPGCAATLTTTIDKDILPILNEFANDEECIVKVAACQTMVDVLKYFSAGECYVGGYQYVFCSLIFHSIISFYSKSIL